MLELSKKYGDPMTLFIGSKPFVLVSNYRLAKDLFQQNVFNSRQDSPTMELMLHGSQDISMSKYGPLWQFHKKTATRCMKTAIENANLVERVSWAVDFAVEQMLQGSGQVEPKLYMRNVAYNVTGWVVFGKTYTVSDPDFLKLQRLVEKGNGEFMKMVALDLLPFARYLPLKLFPATRNILNATNEFKAYIDARVDDHLSTYDAGNIRDFCDAMIQESNGSRRRRRVRKRKN